MSAFTDRFVGATNDTACVACTLEASGKHSLPVDEDGEIVGNDYAGEWVGAPACEGCYIIHAAGGPTMLEVHLRATKMLRTRVAGALEELRKVTKQVASDVLRVANQAWAAIDE